MMVTMMEGQATTINPAGLTMPTAIDHRSPL